MLFTAKLKKRNLRNFLIFLEKQKKIFFNLLNHKQKAKQIQLKFFSFYLIVAFLF
jgi:hypothetical protein